LSEEAFKELEDVHAKALAFIDKHFPDVKQYVRDMRATTISVMGFLIELEKLRVKRLKV